LRAALQAHSPSLARRQVLPLVIRPLRRLPALSLLPGHTPAQEARGLAVGKRVMSVPISATLAAAAVSPTPGMVRSSVTACA